jgi:hypothetical protein
MRTEEIGSINYEPNLQTSIIEIQHCCLISSHDRTIIVTRKSILEINTHSCWTMVLNLLSWPPMQEQNMSIRDALNQTAEGDDNIQ